MQKTIVIAAVVIALFVVQSPTQAQTISDAVISSLLAQFASGDPTTRETAFYSLLDLGVGQNSGQAPYPVPTQVQNILGLTSASSADQVRLGLIGLLTLENGRVASGYQLSSPSVLLNEDDVNYYADLIAAVVALNDVRSIGGLVGALRTGDMATARLASFGDAAIDPLVQQLGGSDSTFQFAAVFAMEEMLDPPNFTSISTATQGKLWQAFQFATGLADVDAANEATQALAKLSGLTSPYAKLSASTIGFGSELLGTGNSAPQNLTLTDTSGSAIAIASVAISGPNNGDFAQTNTCGTPVTVGGICIFNVTFNPTSTGPRAAFLAITTNASGQPLIVALTGSGMDFSFAAATGGSTSATVTAGQSATYNLQLNPLAGFTGSVSLTCTGAPAQATCAPSGTTLTVSGASPAAFQVKVTTTARSLTVPNTNRRLWPQAPRLFVLYVLALACLLALVLKTVASGSPRFARIWAPVAVLLVCFATLMTASGCGGGNSSAPPPPPLGGTPAGTYTLTLTGTQQGVSRTVTLTLTVN